jgi:hypothetical protein
MSKKSLSSLKEHPLTGKKEAVVQSVPQLDLAEPTVVKGNRSRRTKVREDVDSDYAEEAEDFFYGEGM